MSSNSTSENVITCIMDGAEKDMSRLIRWGLGYLKCVCRGEGEGDKKLWENTKYKNITTVRRKIKNIRNKIEYIKKNLIGHYLKKNYFIVEDCIKWMEEERKKDEGEDQKIDSIKQ